MRKFHNNILKQNQIKNLSQYIVVLCLLISLSLSLCLSVPICEQKKSFYSLINYVFESELYRFSESN